MPYRHGLQSSRFELKYIIDEDCALGIRNFVSSYLELDSYCRPDLENAYPIASLYLDTPDLFLYGQTCQGIKNRFKLRIRFYDDHADSPVFLEVKRRITDVICKERAMVNREAVRRVLRGDGPDLSYLADGNDDLKSGSALQNFCRLCDQVGALPQVYVSYIREAFVSPNSDRLRVTFDRQLLSSPYQEGFDLALPGQGAWPDVGGVILELKFTDRFPAWMREMSQAFNLQRTSVPKYVHCIDTLGIRPGQRLGVELGISR